MARGDKVEGMHRRRGEDGFRCDGDSERLCIQGFVHSIPSIRARPFLILLSNSTH